MKADFEVYSRDELVAAVDAAQPGAVIVVHGAIPMTDQASDLVIEEGVYIRLGDVEDLGGWTMSGNLIYKGKGGHER